MVQQLAGCEHVFEGRHVTGTAVFTCISRYQKTFAAVHSSCSMG